MLKTKIEISKIEIKSERDVYNIALWYWWVNLEDILLEEVERFNEIKQYFELSKLNPNFSNPWNKPRNTELLKKFIIYISAYISTDKYCEYILDYVSAININFNSSYIDSVLGSDFDKKTVRDFFDIIKYIQNNRWTLSRDTNKFKYEADNNENVNKIFTKNTKINKSFINHIRNHSKVIVTWFITILWLQTALWNISEISEQYREEACKNISDTILLSEKEFGIYSQEISQIYQKLAEAWVYDSLTISNLQNLESKLDSLKKEKNNTILELEITKNSQNLMDTLKSLLSDDQIEDPIKLLEDYLSETQINISNTESQINLEKENLEKEKSDLMKNLWMFASALMHHETWVKISEPLIKWVNATNPKDRNWLKSVWLFQANGKNPTAKINKLANTWASIAWISNDNKLDQVEKQVLWFFGHMKDIWLGNNTKKVIKNIIKHDLLTTNINPKFQTKKTNHRNTRNAILVFIKKYWEKYNIHNMIYEYENTKSSNLLDKIMLNIVAWATNEFIENPTDNGIKNIVKVLASGTQVWCSAIWVWTTTNLLKINKTFSENTLYASR